MSGKHFFGNTRHRMLQLAKPHRRVMKQVQHDGYLPFAYDRLQCRRHSAITRLSVHLLIPRLRRAIRNEHARRNRIYNMKVVAVVGSIRKQSYNKQLAEFVKARYADSIELEILSLPGK
ncbi:MAG: hypothetical protein K0Q59_4763 [Paenibacillus sp.]|jgi:hypothetical protein|nr:hypothetical protein [Paenibacillus sp.]